MKLLDLLSNLEDYGRVKRSSWINKYLVRKVKDTGALILCDLNGLQLMSYVFSLEDLTSEDWESI